MAHASSDSEMDSYDKLMDDAMGVWHECFEQNYGNGDFDEEDKQVEDEEYMQSSAVDSEIDEASRNDSGEESNENLFKFRVGASGDVKLASNMKPNFFEIPVEINGDIVAIHEEKPRFFPEEVPVGGFESNGDNDNVENPVGGVDSDGEDPVERNEYEIELLASQFEEDPEVRHDVYYDSGAESEDVEGKRRRESFSPRYDGVLYKGQIFFSGIGFKEVVLYHALKNQRNIRQVRYDKRKIGFTCLGKGKKGNRCMWRCFCSVRKGQAKWMIRKIAIGHSCEKSGEVKMLKVAGIARLFLDQIREEPEYFKPMKMEELFFERWGVSVTRNQVQAARVKALKWIAAEYDEQFRRLRDYGNEIIHSNPGSSVQVDSYKNGEGEEVFWRFYVCFDVLKRSWKATCRPLIGIDGAFLKSKVKGQLLVAMGRDGDNRIYPVAWGVVEKEDSENWVWFVKKVKQDLGLGDGEGYIMVSDRQKGLIKAVTEVLPRVEHRHCVRHIYANLKSRFGQRDPMKKFIWDLAWSYNEAEYKARLQDVKNFDREVYAWVIDSNPRSWCRAFYRLGPCCEDVENNSTESWNRIVAKAREKPFVPMLELIRSQAMSRINKRSLEIERHDGNLTPYATKKLQLEEDDAKKCKIKASTGGMFQASLSGCIYRVHLNQKTCTCRKWQITGIPCVHAYGVILHRKLDVDEYVAKWFYTETWRRTYLEGITPPRGAAFWPSGSHPPLRYPPDSAKMLSKDKKRKKGKNESPSKKRPKEEKRIMHCGVCGMQGHNSRYHGKNPDKGGKKQDEGVKKQHKGTDNKSKGEKKKSKEGTCKGVEGPKNNQSQKQGKGGKKKQGKGTHSAKNLHDPE